MIEVSVKVVNVLCKCTLKVVEVAAVGSSTVVRPAVKVYVKVVIIL